MMGLWVHNDLCTYAMGLRSQGQTWGTRKAAKDLAQSRGSSPRHPELPLGQQLPPQPSPSPSLLYTSAEKSKENSKSLNVFFHQFSSTFGVSAAAFSPQQLFLSAEKELICGLLPPVFRWK